MTVIQVALSALHANMIMNYQSWENVLKMLSINASSMALKINVSYVNLHIN